MSDSDVFVEHTAASTGNELSAAKGDRFFEQARRDRRANTWMKERQPPALVRNLIHAVRTILPFVFHCYPGAMLFNDFVDHIFKERNHTMLGQVTSADDL
jgi:hypothetical protein